MLFTTTPMEELQHWRRITVLNVIYKLLPKMLPRRLQPYLSELILDCRTGFIQERRIFYSIILFWKMVAFVELRKQNLAVLFLNFEKAYDKVDWDFMEGTLARMGFPNAWIRGVSAFYRDAYSSCKESVVILVERKRSDVCMCESKERERETLDTENMQE